MDRRWPPQICCPCLPGFCSHFADLSSLRPTPWLVRCTIGVGRISPKTRGHWGIFLSSSPPPVSWFSFLLNIDQIFRERLFFLVCSHRVTRFAIEYSFPNLQRVAKSFSWSVHSKSGDFLTKTPFPLTRFSDFVTRISRIHTENGDKTLLNLVTLTPFTSSSAHDIAENRRGETIRQFSHVQRRRFS